MPKNEPMTRSQMPVQNMSSGVNSGSGIDIANSIDDARSVQGHYPSISPLAGAFPFAGPNGYLDSRWLPPAVYPLSTQRHGINGLLMLAPMVTLQQAVNDTTTTFIVDGPNLGVGSTAYWIVRQDSLTADEIGLVSQATPNDNGTWTINVTRGLSGIARSYDAGTQIFSIAKGWGEDDFTTSPTGISRRIYHRTGTGVNDYQPVVAEGNLYGITDVGNNEFYGWAVGDLKPSGASWIAYYNNILRLMDSSITMYDIGDITQYAPLLDNAGNQIVISGVKQWVRVMFAGGGKFSFNSPTESSINAHIAFDGYNLDANLGRTHSNFRFFHVGIGGEDGDFWVGSPTSHISYSLANIPATGDALVIQHRNIQFSAQGMKAGDALTGESTGTSFGIDPVSGQLTAENAEIFGTLHVGGNSTLDGDLSVVGKMIVDTNGIALAPGQLIRFADTLSGTPTFAGWFSTTSPQAKTVDLQIATVSTPDLGLPSSPSVQLYVESISAPLNQALSMKLQVTDSATAKIVIDNAGIGVTPSLELEGCLWVGAPPTSGSSGDIFATGTIRANTGFSANGSAGLTQNVTISGTTLHFISGILTAVT